MKPPEPYRSAIREANLARMARGELWYQRGEPRSLVTLEWGEDVSPEQREAFLAALREAVEVRGGRLEPAPPYTEGRRE